MILLPSQWLWVSRVVVLLIVLRPRILPWDITYMIVKSLMSNAHPLYAQWCCPCVASIKNTKYLKYLSQSIKVGYPVFPCRSRPNCLSLMP